MTSHTQSRWIALLVLCMGTLMIVLDTTIVNVALPSIRADLHFSQTSLAWVVNGYMLTFGGFLLLGGRLGDLFGHRRLFMAGITLFSVASLACGLASSQGMLVAARVVQGLGGAVVSAVSLSLMMSLFVEPAERAKAMGLFGFVAAGGGSLGVLLGGILTDVLNWHWIFLVNVPIGAAVCVSSLRLLPRSQRPSAAAAPRHHRRAHRDGGSDARRVRDRERERQRLDLGPHARPPRPGRGVVRGLSGRSSRACPRRSCHCACSARAICRVANLIGVLWAAAMFAWFFLSALYLQLVLGYSPLQVGLAFLPANLIMGAFSLGLSAKLVMRFGIRAPLAIGLGLADGGAVAPGARPGVRAASLVDVLPSMILLGFGAGLAFNPVLLAAMGDVSQSEAGLASGIVNTSFMMGGALGLAVLASVAASRTDQPAWERPRSPRRAHRRLPQRLRDRCRIRAGGSGPRGPEAEDRKPRSRRGPSTRRAVRPWPRKRDGRRRLASRPCPTGCSSPRPRRPTH